MTFGSVQREQQPAPRPRRSVYKYRGRILGQNAYYAITSSGELLNGCLYVASDLETDAEIVSRLFIELDRVDPVRPPLRLVKSAVAASIDGPSPFHPAIAQVEYDGKVIPFRAPATSAPTAFCDEITRGLYERLYLSLYGVLPSWNDVVSDAG